MEDWVGWGSRDGRPQAEAQRPRLSPSGSRRAGRPVVSLAEEPVLVLAPFTLDVIPDRHSVTVLPRGELDLATRDQLSAEILRLRAAGFRRIVLDLSETSFMDSSGLICVVRLCDLAAQDGYDLTLRQGPEPVRRLFELTGLTGRLPFA